MFLQEWLTTRYNIQLSATDVSARTTMKGAAKCDKHCELQNSVNQQELERTLRFRDIPESMPASASNSTTAGGVVHHSVGTSFVRSCAFGRFVPLTHAAQLGLSPHVQLTRRFQRIVVAAWWRGR
jgi:hypothetical protein